MSFPPSVTVISVVPAEGEPGGAIAVELGRLVWAGRAGRAEVGQQGAAARPVVDLQGSTRRVGEQLRVGLRRPVTAVPGAVGPL